MKQEVPEFIFTTHCAGRYQLDLPADMVQIKGTFSVPDIALTLYAENDNSQAKGVLRGDDRLERWQAYVEARRLDDDKHYATQYLFKELTNEVQTLVFSTDRKHPKVGQANPDTMRSFDSYFFHDYPEKELGIVITGGLGRGVFDYSVDDYQQQFKQRLKIMHQQASQVVYAPWPHSLPGICLSREFTFEHAEPNRRESYLIKFFNGKTSTLNLQVGLYEKGTEENLKRELSRNSGLIAFFGSQKMTVAGRKGRLFISDGKYSTTQREFRWVSTDTKTGSTLLAHLEISGKIEAKDYPSFAPLGGTDIVVGLLKSIKVRENGMLGVK